MRLEKKTMPVRYDNGTAGQIEINVPVREKNKCYIVGCAGSKELVPWDDPDAEYWGVNNLYGVPLKGAHFDRWFEIHNIWYDKNLNCLLRRGNKDFRGQSVADYLKGLAALNIPVYMQKYWVDAVPNSVPYPLQEVIQFFKDKGLTSDMAKYLTNTISIETALAIREGFKEIQIWGVDMAVGTEYEHQRPSCEFWLGIAQGMGIKIYIPDEADLLKTRFIYGFEETKQMAFNHKTDDMVKNMSRKLGELQNRIAADKSAADQYAGAIHAVKEVKKIWSNLDDTLTGLRSS